MDEAARKEACVIRKSSSTLGWPDLETAECETRPVQTGGTFVGLNAMSEGESALNGERGAGAAEEETESGAVTELEEVKSPADEP